MKDTRTVSLRVVTVVRTLLLPLASKSFMIVVALRTPQVVAPVAALFAVGDSRQHLALVIPNIMRPSVPVVDVQPLYHLCLVKTARFTVVNVISHSEPHVLLAVMTRVAIAMVVVVVVVMVDTVIAEIVVIVVIVVITVIAGETSFYRATTRVAPTCSACSARNVGATLVVALWNTSELFAKILRAPSIY